MSGLSWSYGTKCGLQALRRAPMPLATGFRFSAISSSEPFRVSRRAAAVRRLTPPERLALGTPTAQLPIVHYFSVQIDGRMRSLAIASHTREILEVWQAGTGGLETASHFP